MSSKAMAFAGCLALEAPLARHLPQVTSLHVASAFASQVCSLYISAFPPR